MSDAGTDDFVYGVAHVNSGALGHVSPKPTRDAAETDLRDCLREGAECYLVRAPRNPWERVPEVGAPQEATR